MQVRLRVVLVKVNPLELIQQVYEIKRSENNARLQ